MYPSMGVLGLRLLCTHSLSFGNHDCTIRFVFAKGNDLVFKNDLGLRQWAVLVQHHPISSAKIILELGDILWDELPYLQATH